MAWSRVTSAIGACITSMAAAAGAMDETRYCGPPPRDASGSIIRRADVLREFERRHPRPHDGRRWYRDHVIPLACGGCDAVANLQWLPEEMWRAKSQWERKVYGGRGLSEGCP
jgi:hypothetical protein